MTSLVDEIFQKLKKGESFDKILEEHGQRKSSLYEAVRKYLLHIKAEIDRLTSEERELSERVAEVRAKNEAAKKHALELEQTGQKLKREKGELEREKDELARELEAKAKLLGKAESIERLGFTVKMLEQLRGTLSEICAKRGVEPKQALDVFFKDLDSYDAERGLELKLEQLQTLIKTRSSEASRWEAESKKLELQYADRRAVVDVVEDLMRQGVGVEHILAWGRILDTAGKTPEELEVELERYGKVGKIVKGKTKEIQALDSKSGKLKSKVVSLEKHEREIESSILALSDSGVKEIEKVREKAKSELASLMAEVKRWGEMEVEAGKLEEELKLARYIRARDPAVISLFPKEVVVSLQDKVRLWLELNEVNPKVKLPDRMCEKYPLLARLAGTEFELLDLVELARVALVKIEVQEK